VTQPNPYLGLQYFDEETAHLFFGRDEYVTDLVEKIEETRFLAVLGHSGSGKSSLVRAGLIPALRAESGPWVVAKFRPETTPLASLARALDTQLLQSASEADLRRGPFGIVDAFERSTRCQPGARLLVLADQFEELFRLEEETASQPGAREEASAFVRLLLHANRHPGIYVVITMRSDYLKDCARYRDLPERINRGIYLVPRMKRDELEMAITGPARAAGVAPDPPLVQRLLNDAAGPDLDHLPLIEHLLARIWEKGAVRGALTIHDYESAGGWSACLSNHADDLYGPLSETEKRACEQVFRRLTLRDEANRDVRSRATLGQLIAWCNGQEAAVRSVVNRFRAPQAALLTPVGEGELRADTLIDITHESLIRNWTKLIGEQGWIQQETEARETFRGLELRSRRKAGQRGQLKGSELTEAEALVRGTFSEAWVSRYFPPSARERVAKFVRSSRWENWRARALRWGFLLTVVGVLTVAAFPTFKREWRQFRKSSVGTVNPKDGLRYVSVPPGEFQMGCSPGDTECGSNEQPPHTVQISKGFVIGQTEVTQAAYEKVMKTNPSYFKGPDRPVDQVPWKDAHDYCVAVGMRLPTEAEWEYAARAGSKQARYGNLDQIAWYGLGISQGPQPVAAKDPNQWGLYDMLGNVWEWTNDNYDADYYRTSPKFDPQGPTHGDFKVVRGGSWVVISQLARVSDRLRYVPSFRSYSIGFRCARE
jgi:energy-coupling factor transporter ATP-binding protein EcfA2